MKKRVKSILLFIVVGGFIFAQSPEILFLEGQEKIKEGAFVQADSLFNKALELDNTYAPAMFQLTQLNLRLGNMEKAQKYIREAVEIDREQYIETETPNTPPCAGCFSLHPHYALLRIYAQRLHCSHRLTCDRDAKGAI